jgi:hypothetical protein
MLAVFHLLASKSRHYSHNRYDIQRKTVRLFVSCLNFMLQVNARQRCYLNNFGFISELSREAITLIRTYQKMDKVQYNIDVTGY